MSRVQIACDKCTLGVMDQDNPHLHGTCSCACHRYPFPGLKARMEISPELAAVLEDQEELDRFEVEVNDHFLRGLADDIDRQAMGEGEPQP